MLIAIGAILAFAVNFRTTGIDMQAVGAILIVIGLVGLILSFTALESLFGYRRGYETTSHTAYRDDVTPPHTHRRVESTDVVVEDDAGAHVERETRIRNA
jgi:hypothetical protein